MAHRRGVLLFSGRTFWTGLVSHPNLLRPTLSNIREPLNPSTKRAPFRPPTSRRPLAASAIPLGSWNDKGTPLLPWHRRRTSARTSPAQPYNTPNQSDPIRAPSPSGASPMRRASYYYERRTGCHRTHMRTPRPALASTDVERQRASHLRYWEKRGGSTVRYRAPKP